MKKILSFVLVLVFIVTLFTSCDNGNNTDGTLSFSQVSSLDEIKKLDGKQVTIVGYMSTMLHSGGEFMYLTNLPYQSAPACVADSSELSNTIAVYAKAGEDFEFTDMAIQVTGVIELGAYTDEYGYTYSYRIKDAAYKLLDASDMSGELGLWQELASSGAIADVYKMLDYLSFVCFWPTYTEDFSGGEDYLSPEYALRYIETDGERFNYGLADGYFDNIVKKIKDVDETAFAELVEIVEDAKSLCDKAYSELKAGNYVMVSQYSGAFADERGQYKMDTSAEIGDEYDGIFEELSMWLGEWEL